MKLKALVLLSATALALLGLGASPALAQVVIRGFSYNVSTSTYTAIDDPKAVRGTVVFGTNDSGQVVGGWYDASNNVHSFVMSGGVYTDLGLPIGPAGGGAGGVSINNAGQIVGQYGGADKRSHGFLYDGSTYTTIDNPNAPLTGEGTYLRAINNSGQIVGWYDSASGDLNLTSGPAPGPIYKAFIYSAGTFTPVAYPGANFTEPTDIDDAGNVIGFYTVGAVGGRFRLSGGVYTPIPNDPVGMNNAGQLVGESLLPSNCQSAAGAPICSYYAYIINGGALTTLSNPLATRGTVPMKISNSGQIVGYYYP